MNILQVPQIAFPRLAAKFGGASAIKHLKEAYGDMGKNTDVLTKMMRSATFWQGESDLPDIDTMKFAKNDAEKKAMLKVMLERSVLDFTQESELASLIKGTPKVLQVLTKSASWLSHPAEVSNRIVTAIAAYQAARDAGQSIEQATETAHDLTMDTQLDYSPENRIGLLNNAVMRPVLQFKQFSQQVSWMYAKAIKQAFSKDPEIRREQRAFLMYSLISALPIAGVRGIPFMGTVLLIASLFSDDDDDPKDLAFELEQALGPLLANGVMGPFFSDWSRRVGLGDVLPFFGGSAPGVPKAKTSEKLKDSVYDAVGPFGGIARNYADAVDYADRGEYMKAMEFTLPKMLKDTMKAFRYAEEGMTTSDGIVRVGNSEFSPLDLLSVAAGFKPTKEGEVADKANYLYRKEQMLTLRASLLRHRLMLVNEHGDEDDISSAEAAVEKFNTKNPEFEITKTVKGKETRQKYADETEGLGFTKQSEALASRLGLFDEE
jgi:hypothetical protein